MYLTLSRGVTASFSQSEPLCGPLPVTGTLITAWVSLNTFAHAEEEQLTSLRRIDFTDTLKLHPMANHDRIIPIVAYTQ